MDHDLSDTKALSTLKVSPLSGLSLELGQSNDTQSHGTTVWHSAIQLAFYLADTLKPPKFNLKEGILHPKETKRCLELGSGCGLSGLTMAALGFDTTLTDLPVVVDKVLTANTTHNLGSIKDYWYDLQQAHQHSARMADPKVCAKPLDWLNLDASSNWLETHYHYILSADCIYSIELVQPLLECMFSLASPTTTVLVAMERRDALVVDGFVEKARCKGFEARIVPKKLVRTALTGNEDVEIWRLKKKRTRES
ncbi:putative methyltransferase-domain-containing protein [Phycomyces nitens]|nr:putative methyltransferase-domain-containing protein [Phycomyces nitens]